MIPAVPVGWPGIAAFYLGMAAFVVALLGARRRSPRAAGGTRSRRSIRGIVIEGAGFAAIAFGPVRVALDPTCPAAIATLVAVVLLMTTTVAVFVGATRAMGRNWSIVARTLGDHRLVETGPFAHVRHPIYAALFLMLVGFAIAYGHYAQLLVAVPLYAIGTWLRVAEEERLLHAMFGADYAAYAARVPGFVPGLF